MKADQRLESLRREAEQKPEDAEAAARYESELLRAGQSERLKERLRLDVVCPLRWEELQPTLFRSRVRFCDQCQEKVYWVDSEEELKRRAAMGQCVAVFDNKELLKRIETPGSLNKPLTIKRSLDGIVRDALAGEPLAKPGCLVGGDRVRPAPPPRGVYASTPSSGPGLFGRVIRRLRGKRDQG